MTGRSKVCVFAIKMCIRGECAFVANISARSSLQIFIGFRFVEFIQLFLIRDATFCARLFCNHRSACGSLTVWTRRDENLTSIVEFIRKRNVTGFPSFDCLCRRGQVQSWSCQITFLPFILFAVHPRFYKFVLLPMIFTGFERHIFSDIFIALVESLSLL